MPKKLIYAILATIVFVVLVWLLIVSLSQNNTVDTGDANPAATEGMPEEDQLSPTAKVYNSDRLGISFSYESKPAEGFEVKVTEMDNKIYLHGTNEEPANGKIIEVFEKNPTQILAEAIEEEFLRTYSSEDCFVVNIPQAEEDPRPDNYVMAEISYPEPADSTDPFWQNASKCPDRYAKTNAVQYFMMNVNAPDKYVFLVLGQDSITSDGVIRDTNQWNDWSGSVRIK